MACSEKEKSPLIDWGWKKPRNLNAPISLEYLMVKELPLSLEDGDMRTLLVCTDPTNEDLTRVKQTICILDHPKNLLEVLRARLAISQGLNGNNITTRSNQYRFTRTFLDGEALLIFDLKSNELRHKTFSDLILVNGSYCDLFWTKRVPLQAEALHTLQDG